MSIPNKFVMLPLCWLTVRQVLTTFNSKTASGVCLIYRRPGYERVYLPLCKVADTPFHIQGDDMLLCQHLNC